VSRLCSLVHRWGPVLSIFRMGWGWTRLVIWLGGCWGSINAVRRWIGWFGGVWLGWLFVWLIVRSWWWVRVRFFWILCWGIRAWEGKKFFLCFRLSFWWLRPKLCLMCLLGFYCLVVGQSSRSRISLLCWIGNHLHMLWWWDVGINRKRIRSRRSHLMEWNRWHYSYMREISRWWLFGRG
jgi:hypothetical protein